MRQMPLYHGDTVYARLEKEILSRGLATIGNPKFRDEFFIQIGDNAGEQRWAWLDMTKEQRAYRTVDVKNLSMEGLLKLHTYEQDRMTRFAIGPSEIFTITRERIPDQVTMNKDQIIYMAEFNAKNRPLMNRKIFNMPIPPYFVYDCEFDGMIYHHAWDLSVWYQDYEMPEDNKIKATHGSRD